MRRISRRRFLGAAGALCSTALVDGFLREPSAIEVSRHDVPLPGSPTALGGLRIACLTDVHLAHGAGPAAPAVWLVHAPAYVDGLRPDITPRPAAILAGHTHGGQIRLPFYTPYTPTGSGRFVAGWYRDTVAPLYVSRGIGTILIPARFCCPPELPVFTLRRG